MLDEIGSRVRLLRKERGWNQRELCRRAGLSARYLVQLESGSANLSVLRLADVARALDVSLVRLLSGLGPVQDAEEALVSHWTASSKETRERVKQAFGIAHVAKVALIGLRGAGKSTVGRAVGKQLRWDFVELDEEVRTMAGMTLRDLFEYHGVEQYRTLRMQALQQVLAREGSTIIEVGGSVVLDDEAYTRLKESCYTVWLKATPFEHLKRVKDQGDTRPMSGRINPLGELRAILLEREPFYGQAREQIDTAGVSLPTVIERVAEACGRAQNE
jgi:XRE family aerobic/anaerobic benzoate catabolism transcriptional regulator